VSYRAARVAREMRDRLADVVATRVRDPRLASLTLIEVKPAPDLSFARVFYRCSEESREDAAKALRKATPFLRRCLAETLDLRRVPELDFRFDPTLDSAARVESILDELAAEREAKGLPLENPSDGASESDGAPRSGDDSGEPE
jgi:ribosome-binding factor A